MKTSPTYSKSITVSNGSTDGKGRLKITDLCDFFQECAGEHAEELGVGPQLRKENLAWVLSKMKISIDKMPKENQKISIETWPKGIDKLFALRDFKMKSSQGEVIGNATTSWLLINLQNKRPRRVDMVTSRFTNHHVDALESNYEPISAPVTWSTQEPYQVESNDLDANDHTNNVSYIRWFMSCLPEKLKSKVVQSLEVHFLAETFVDNKLVIKQYWDESENLEVLLQIVRPKDHKVVAKARLQLQ